MKHIKYDNVHRDNIYEQQCKRCGFFMRWYSGEHVGNTIQCYSCRHDIVKTQKEEEK